MHATTFILDCPSCGHRFPISKLSIDQDFTRCLGVTSSYRVHIECTSCKFAIDVGLLTGQQQESPHWGLKDHDGKTDRQKEAEANAKAKAQVQGLRGKRT
jgi:hypothetical protein